jgi:transcription elongation factor Elf1
MGDLTLGRITSEPNSKGEHTLKCPKCDHDFLSTITKDDKTGAIDDTICSLCGYRDQPKMFVAAAHKTEVNSVALDYAKNELTRIFKNIR